MKVRELLDSPEKWTKGGFARTPEGEHVFPNHAQAVCFCISGAIDFCYSGEKRYAVYRQLNEKIAAKQWQDIYAWNDAPERTYEEVKALVDELDI